MGYIVLLEWSHAVHTTVYSTHNVHGIVCLELGIREAKLVEVCPNEFEQSDVFLQAR